MSVASKVKKKLAKVAGESAARNKASEELLQRQLTALQAAVPGLVPGVVPSGLLPYGAPATMTPAPAKRNWSPWIFGGALLAAVAIAAGRRA